MEIGAGSGKQTRTTEEPTDWLDLWGLCKQEERIPDLMSGLGFGEIEIGIWSCDEKSWLDTCFFFFISSTFGVWRNFFFFLGIGVLQYDILVNPYNDL